MKKGIFITAIGGIIAGLIVQYFTPVYRTVIDILSSLWEGITWIWLALIFDYQIPGFVIIFASLLSIFGIVKILTSILSIFQPEIEPEFLKYREDVIYGAKWCWTWSSNRIANLHALCPYCDAELVAMQNLDETRFICERCSRGRNNQFGDHRWRNIATIPSDSPSYALEVIEREIRRRIRTNSYNKIPRE